MEGSDLHRTAKADFAALRPITCSSPSPVARTLGRSKDHSNVRELSGSLNFPSNSRTPPGHSKPVIPRINRSTKDLRTYLRILEGRKGEKDRNEREVSPEIHPTASHSPTPTHAAASNTSQAAKYAQRMRRIQRQVQEMAEMGLISSRGNEPLLRDFEAKQSYQPQARVPTTEFWGKREKMQLIQKLGFAEAYREFQARQSTQKAHILSPSNLLANSLRRSCPTSPSALLVPNVKASGQSTAAATPEATDLPRKLRLRSAQKPRLTVLNKIMEKCDQFFYEKPAKRVGSTSKLVRLHRRSQSDFRTPVL